MSQWLLEDFHTVLKTFMMQQTGWYLGMLSVSTTCRADVKVHLKFLNSSDMLFRHCIADYVSQPEATLSESFEICKCACLASARRYKGC